MGADVHPDADSPPFAGRRVLENAPNLPECRLFVGHMDIGFRHMKRGGTTIRRMLALPRPERDFVQAFFLTTPVSYTHLTLPTILLV